ncbi:hypothetical protein MJH12_06635, partial [bacterium]|nr:hypothetical protein [bacterium]
LATDVYHYHKIKHLRDTYGDALRILYVNPWISYTQPLNMLVDKAFGIGASELILQSIDVWTSRSQMSALISQMDDKTLVVGAKMDEFHGRKEGLNPISGWCCPWNTLAIWDLKKLGITGFLPLSGGNLDDLQGGVEEVMAISILQQIINDQCRAKIVNVGTVKWDVDWPCSDRAKAHQIKMESKNKRAKNQMNYLNLQTAQVEVINTLMTRSQDD